MGDKMLGVTSAKVVITKSMIDLPAPKVYVYDNKEKELVIPGFTITGTTKATEEGEYKAKLALAETNSSEWSATAKGMLNSDGTTIDYCWYIVKDGDSVADGEKAIKPLSLSVYTMDSLDGLSGSGNKMNCIVVAEQTVPDTKATLWTFAPTSTGTNAPKMVEGATGYIFTKYEVDGVQKYYYLGVDGSNNLKVVEKTTEKMTSGDASGITSFYMKADSSTVQRDSSFPIRQQKLRIFTSVTLSAESSGGIISLTKAVADRFKPASRKRSTSLKLKTAETPFPLIQKQARSYRKPLIPQKP